LERIDFRKRCDCAGSVPRGRNDCIYCCLENEWARGVVDDDDASFCRKIIQSAAHGVAALVASDTDQQAAQIALEEPWRRISRVRPGDYRNYHAYVGTLLEQLHAVQQHRFASNPAELFQLVGAGACSGSSSDDDDADVLQSFSHENSRLNISAMVATPTA